MFWPHVVPGNGLVANTDRNVHEPLANPLTTTYRERSNLTSFGSKSMFSVATEGGSTSESTPTTGGMFGLLLSYGAQAAQERQDRLAAQQRRGRAGDARHLQRRRRPAPGLAGPARLGQPVRLRPPERPTRRMAAVAKGDIPPVDLDQEPRLVLPVRPGDDPSVPVTGHVEARRAESFRYELQFAPGLDPADSDFAKAGSGDRQRHLRRQGRHARPGRAARARSGTRRTRCQATRSCRRPSSTPSRCGCGSWDDQDRMGEERRTIAVHHDPTLRAGFPQKFGIGGESQPALADLQGTGHEAIVFGDADGRVHAIDGVSGKELPGWPAQHQRRARPRPRLRPGPRADHRAGRGRRPGPRRAPGRRGHQHHRPYVRLRRLRQGAARLAEDARTPA